MNTQVNKDVKAIQELLSKKEYQAVYGQYAPMLQDMLFVQSFEEWLDFILACRNGKDIWKFDIVIGGVANDKVFNTIELYLDQLIDKTEAIRRLRYEKPNLQVCFRTQEAIDRYLRFEGSERV